MFLTGETPGLFIQPVWTMSLALPKTGLALGGVGQLMLADIGIPEGAYRRIGLPYAPPFGDHYRVLLSAVVMIFLVAVAAMGLGTLEMNGRFAALLELIGEDK